MEKSKEEPETEAQGIEDILKDHLSVLAEVQVPPRVTLEEVVEKSKNFVVPFPIETARLSTLEKKGHDKEKLEEHINSAYPIIHEKVLPLLAAFIQHKKVHGRKKERKLYADLDLLGLVDRFLSKRPIVFFTDADSYLLRDGTVGSGSWEEIGHSGEHGRLTLSDYMSYDEIKLSALVSVSSHSFFINNGGRHNRGVPGNPGTFQPEGVIIGMVGARLEKTGVMEWQDCVVTPEQNVEGRGYGPNPPPKYGLLQKWGALWNLEIPTWNQAQSDESKFVKLSPKIMFNSEVYKARVRLSAETFLAEAGTRAKSAGKLAYVNVVGLGLGVWQLVSDQQQIFVDAFGDAIKTSDTSNIAHIDFTWIPVNKCHDTGNDEVFPGTEITIHFSQRPLHSPVPSDTLLVTNFAWDGNSLPGNEYWKGMLSASGDPAAACSSTIAELHNALINPRVSACNLHIASSSGVEHISEYAKRKLQ